MKKTPLSYARELHAAIEDASSGERRDMIRGFLRGLARNRKMSLLPRIVEAFRYVALAEEGYRPGQIVSARPLDASMRAKLGKAWNNVAFEEWTDPSLLGGAIVEVEDTRIDGSVRTQLDSLKRTIAKTA